MKTRYLKARLPAREYDALKAAADAAGVTLSDHVRTVLATQQAALDQARFLMALEAHLQAAPVAVSDAAPADLEPLLTEVLLLARELAADRNAQMLARVAQQLNHLFPNRRLT